MNLRAILCDLDDTLFDHSHAAREALAKVMACDLAARDWPFNDVEAKHTEILDRLHADVLAGRRTIDAARVERFRLLIGAFDGDATLDRAAEWAAAYRTGYETVWRPVAGALEFLAAAKERQLAVAIVTNNLHREQLMKLDRCGLANYVTTLVTSEEVGASKPSAEIFQSALDRLNMPASDAVMIGDSWISDIEGARRCGLRAIWFNPRGLTSPDPTVPELRSFTPVDAVFALLDSIQDVPQYF